MGPRRIVVEKHSLAVARKKKGKKGFVRGSHNSPRVAFLFFKHDGLGRKTLLPRSPEDFSQEYMRQASPGLHVWISDGSVGSNFSHFLSGLKRLPQLKH